MKQLYILIISTLLIGSNGHAQNWSSTGALEATGGAYLTCATNLGDEIYVIGLVPLEGDVLVYSTDQGTTWNTPSGELPEGDFTYLKGAGNRLYGQVSINTFDHALYYTEDQGATWVPDTVGLPNSLTNTGKAAVNFYSMGGDWIVASTFTEGFVKQIGDEEWQAMGFIDYSQGQFAYTSDKWLAFGSPELYQSTDHGASWTPLSVEGLPEDFGGSTMASNHVNRLFVAAPPSDGGEAIYFSDDQGETWSETNAEGQFDHPNPWVSSMYAVDDYVFASVLPIDFQQEPPYLMSPSENPNFEIGDVSGMPTGQTNTTYPFFFHIGNKLYTMFWDLHVTEPGFVGTPTAVLENDKPVSKVYPNPSQRLVNIETDELVNWRLVTLDGKLMDEGTSSQIDISEFPKGMYLLQVSGDKAYDVLKIVRQ